MKRYNRSERYKPEVLGKLHGVQVEMLKDFMSVCNKYDLPCFAMYGTALGAVRHHGFIPWDDDIDMGMLRSDYNKFLKVFSKELGDKYNLLTPNKDPRYACTVTHIQKKGTKFISEVSKDLKCEQCIFMDIFPLDYVAEGKKRAYIQKLRTTFWRELLFLIGTGYPIIPYDGLIGELMSIACRCIHAFLRIFRVSPRTVYRKYVKSATAHNKRGGGKYVTCFESTKSLEGKMRVDEILPVHKVPFENTEIPVMKNVHNHLKSIYGDYMKLPPKDQRINHMPLVLDFGDADPSL